MFVVVWKEINLPL